jgi:putative hemolysin
LLSGFFSGSETALFSASKQDLYALSKEKNRAAQLIVKMLQKPKELLVIILAGNLFVNILLSTVSNNLSIKFFGAYGPFATILILTPILLLLGEVIPKNLGINHARAYRKFSIRPLYFFGLLIAPIRFTLTHITEFFFKILNIKDEEHKVSIDELKSSVRASQKLGILKASESKYILNIMKMKSREAQHVMVQRNETIFIEHNASIQETRSVFLKNNVSLLPVYKGHIDHIVGFIFLKDIISFKFGLKKARNINRIIIKANFFPYTKDLIELLNDFRNLGIRVAVIMDEFGGTAGIVTLKDIISSIMGFNPNLDPDKKVKQLNNTTFKVSGDILLDDFNDIFKTHLKSEQTETLNGFLLEIFGKIPVKGETLIFNKNKFTVLRMNENRIEEIFFKISKL